MWLRRWSVCLQCRRPGFSPWVGKIPWRRQWQPTPVLLPGKSHGRRSPVGYSHDWVTLLHFTFTSELYTYGEYLFISAQRTLFSIPYKAGLVVTNSLSFWFFWKVLISFSILKDRFEDKVFLFGRFFSFTTLNTYLLSKITQCMMFWYLVHMFIIKYCFVVCLILYVFWFFFSWSLVFKSCININKQIEVYILIIVFLCTLLS